MKVEDVPAVWNAKMKEYLGVTPENDAQGCLQDVHWSAGRERRCFGWWIGEGRGEGEAAASLPRLPLLQIITFCNNVQTFRSLLPVTFSWHLRLRRSFHHHRSTPPPFTTTIVQHHHCSTPPPPIATPTITTHHHSPPPAAVFGYFPTYLLGAMYATQIYRHAADQIPDLDAKIAAGEFKPLRVRCRFLGPFCWGGGEGLPWDCSCLLAFGYAQLSAFNIELVEACRLSSCDTSLTPLAISNLQPPTPPKPHQPLFNPPPATATGLAGHDHPPARVTRPLG